MRRSREDQKQILSLVSSFSLEKKQLENMFGSFREVLKTVEAAERDIAECMLKAGGKPISYLSRCIAQIPESAGDDEVIDPVNMTKCD